MSFWIYNVGIGVPIAEAPLMDKRKVIALNELAKSHRVHSTEDEGRNRPKHENLYSLRKKPATAETAYQTNRTGKRHQVFYADQIMSSPVITLADKTTIKTAKQQFRQTRFRHFPIVNSAQQLVGIVSDRDVLPITENTAASITHIMKKHVLTALPQTNIRDICRVMFGQHIGAIPIMGENGELVGIISRSDILRAMMEHGPIELWV